MHFLRLEMKSKDERIENQLTQIQALSRNFMDISQKHHELLIKTSCDSESEKESVGELQGNLEKHEKKIAKLEEKNNELK